MLLENDRPLFLRTVAHALRHAPESHFLEMDADGWVDLDLLLLSLRYSRPECGPLSADDLKAVVGEEGAARFEIKGDKIRALYGHSRATSQYRPSPERPVFLYHGTRADLLDSIRADGLRPMRRRFVHLSSDWNYASAVANKETGTPVVLVVGAYKAAEAGTAFYPANGHVWLADTVPPQFLLIPSPGHSGWG